MRAPENGDVFNESQRYQLDSEIGAAGFRLRDGCGRGGAEGDELGDEEGEREEGAAGLSGIRVDVEVVEGCIVAFVQGVGAIVGEGVGERFYTGCSCPGVRFYV